MQIKRGKRGGRAVLAAALGPGYRHLADPAVNEDSGVKLIALQLPEPVHKIGQPAIDNQVTVGFGADTGGFVSTHGTGHEMVGRRLFDIFSAIMDR